MSAQTGASKDCLINKEHEPILAPVISAVSQFVLDCGRLVTYGRDFVCKQQHLLADG